MVSHTSLMEFPRPFAFAVDDLGWHEGSDLSGSTPPGPHRAGVKRTFDLHDYRAIIAVGKAVGVRIQCLFILSELDRENVLARYPTTTYMREKWDNTSRIGDHQLSIINCVREEAAFMEFGFHGTGHEYWAGDGKQRRAEWYNLADREPWPEESLRGHIQAFKEIMAQYGLTPAHGHSFPESFVPCAYSYYWNPGGNYSLGKLLSEAGVKYANTDFGQIPYQSPPQEVNGGGFDHGTHVINRHNYGNHWYELASLPKVPLDLQYTDIIESHWPNWLAQDDFLQPEITAQWISYYRNVQRSRERYLAKNTEQLHAQWLYNKYTRVEQRSAGTVEIDNTQMPAQAYHNNLLGNLVLKIKLETGQHLASAKLNDEPIPAYFEDEGYGFLYLPRLENSKYVLRYAVGPELLSSCVYNDGTYNVYAYLKHSDHTVISLKVYGTQTIKVNTGRPKDVVSDHTDLVVERFHYDDKNARLLIDVRARNIQGNQGNIILLN